MQRATDTVEFIEKNKTHYLVARLPTLISRQYWVTSRSVSNPTTQPALFISNSTNSESASIEMKKCNKIQIIDLFCLIFWFHYIFFLLL